MAFKGPFISIPLRFNYNGLKGRTRYKLTHFNSTKVQL